MTPVSGLHFGSCLDLKCGLPALEDRSVDHVITDPPYAPSVLKNARSLGHNGDKVKVHEFGYGSLYARTRRRVAIEIARVVRRWAIVFCNVEIAHLWAKDLEDGGLRYVRTGIWVRTNGAPQFTGDRPSVGYEACVIAHVKERMRWKGGGRPAVWSHPIVNGRDGTRIHTTPKPLGLMEMLVRQFTDRGELVCDPFAGSATTGVACLRGGRAFVGWEKNRSFYEAAAARLAGCREQLEIPLAAAGGELS